MCVVKFCCRAHQLTPAHGPAFTLQVLRTQLSPVKVVLILFWSIFNWILNLRPWTHSRNCIYALTQPFRGVNGNLRACMKWMRMKSAVPVLRQDKPRFSTALSTSFPQNFRDLKWKQSLIWILSLEGLFSQVALIWITQCSFNKGSTILSSLHPKGLSQQKIH